MRVFVSYSRADAAFADQLVDGLAVDGLEVLIDRSGIRHGENWRERIGELILRCDTMVFVLSPDSLASDVCIWEIAEAGRRSKRILTVLFRPVDFSKAPAQLSVINAVPFDGLNAVSGTPKLLAALRTDLEWLSAHTRLGERAAEWRAKGDAAELLLRGVTLREAHAMVGARPASAPEITTEQRAYLAASDDLEALALSAEHQRAEELERAKNAAEIERDLAQDARNEAEAARTRTRLALLAVSVVALVAIGLGFWVNASRNAALEAQAVAERRAGRLSLAMLEALIEPGATIATLDFLVNYEVGSREIYEKKLRAPIWPGGGSGLTIGIGYDLGYYSEQQFEADWASELSGATVETLKQAIGVRGPAAKDLVEKLRAVDVPFEPARKVFIETVIPRFYRRTMQAFPGVAELPFACQGALLSLVFNRGFSMRPDDRWREMRAIQAAIINDKLEDIPAQIRSMKRLWEGEGLPGILRRRDQEALSCELAFRLRDRIREQWFTQNGG